MLNKKNMSTFRKVEHLQGEYPADGGHLPQGAQGATRCSTKKDEHLVEGLSTLCETRVDRAFSPQGAQLPAQDAQHEHLEHLEHLQGESLKMKMLNTARSVRWRLHFVDRKPIEVLCTPPASREDMLASWPDATEAEPL
jgi:hypothetical protein